VFQKKINNTLSGRTVRNACATYVIVKYPSNKEMYEVSTDLLHPRQTFCHFPRGRSWQQPPISTNSRNVVFYTKTSWMLSVLWVLSSVLRWRANALRHGGLCESRYPQWWWFHQSQWVLLSRSGSKSLLMGLTKMRQNNHLETRV